MIPFVKLSFQPLYLHVIGKLSAFFSAFWDACSSSGPNYWKQTGRQISFVCLLYLLGVSLFLPSSVVGWLGRVSLGCETCLCLGEYVILLPILAQDYIFHLFFFPTLTALIPSAGWWAEGLCVGFHLLPFSHFSYLWFSSIGPGIDVKCLRP